MSAADHPAGKALKCQLCAEHPNPVVRIKLPVNGAWCCPHCDINLFDQPSRRTEL